jgi:hypothetical protein
MSWRQLFPFIALARKEKQQQRQYLFTKIMADDKMIKKGIKLNSAACVKFKQEFPQPVTLSQRYFWKKLVAPAESMLQQFSEQEMEVDDSSDEGEENLLCLFPQTREKQLPHLCLLQLQHLYRNNVERRLRMKQFIQTMMMTLRMLTSLSLRQEKNKLYE